jgi:REP element-mobilizing transposase RayT
LRPSKAANQLFEYILAVAAGRYEVQLHCWCVLSNHFHLVATDPGRQLPKFEQYLDALVARAFNALYGRWDYFWTAGSYSAVTLLTPADILDKMAYVLANPVKAGSAPERIGGRPVHARRPKQFLPGGRPHAGTAPCRRRPSSSSCVRRVSRPWRRSGWSSWVR